MLIYRWKGENVSTLEVSFVLGKYPPILQANVYGVQVPGEGLHVIGKGYLTIFNLQLWNTNILRMISYISFLFVSAILLCSIIVFSSSFFFISFLVKYFYFLRIFPPKRNHCKLRHRSLLPDIVNSLTLVDPNVCHVRVYRKTLKMIWDIYLQQLNCAWRWALSQPVNTESGYPLPQSYRMTSCPLSCFLCQGFPPYFPASERRCHKA